MGRKYVLDACCGGRMFWFQKQHPQTLYIDVRKQPKGFCKNRLNFSIQPDLIADFRKLPFKEGTFKLIVYDPPHLFHLGETSDMAKKYGVLEADWRLDLSQGFNELWRVLAPGGTLIFKWNEQQIPLKTVLALFKERPLFGHPTAKSGRTIWCVFFKVPISPELK